MFFIVLVCLYILQSVRHQDYLQSNEQIRMKLLSDVCLGPRKNSLSFDDNLDFDLDPGSGLRSGLLGRGLQSVTDRPALFCTVK